MNPRHTYWMSTLKWYWWEVFHRKRWRQHLTSESSLPELS